MRTLRRAWLLWRLVRRLERETKPSLGLIEVISEPESHWSERRRVALANGEPEPTREYGWQVAYCADTSQSYMSRRAIYLEDALERALEEPWRGKMKS